MEPGTYMEGNPAYEADQKLAHNVEQWHWDRQCGDPEDCKAFERVIEIIRGGS